MENNNIWNNMKPITLTEVVEYVVKYRPEIEGLSDEEAISKCLKYLDNSLYRQTNQIFFR